MAMHLRRAISNRNATLLLRNGSSSLQSQRSWFHTPCSRSNGFFRTRYTDPSLSAFGFMQDYRRGFAKGKRSSTSLISLLLVFFFSIIYGVVITKLEIWWMGCYVLRCWVGDFSFWVFGYSACLFVYWFSWIKMMV